MDNNKVTLPRDVAEAIEGLLRLGKDSRWIIDAANGEAVGSLSSKIMDFASQEKENFDVLLSALVNGYTIEQTPEEKVQEYYEELHERCEELSRGDCISYSYYAGKSEGLWETLDLLGIKIEGVNA